MVHFDDVLIRVWLLKIRGGRRVAVLVDGIDLLLELQLTGIVELQTL